MEVVTPNEGTPIFEFAASNGIKSHFWPPNLTGSYDFGVVVSFGKFIPESILALFPLGIINVHPSLLPKYRGGMPIVHALKNGETSTGVTITRINAIKFDTGEIILQKPCSIGENELMPSLYKRLGHLGCECLMEVVNDMPKCLDNCFPQNNKDATNAFKLKKESAVVRWNEMTALEVYNLHRALFSTFELTTGWRGQKVKLVCLFPCDSNTNSLTDKEGTKPEPGSITYNVRTKFLYVQCKDKPITLCSLKYKMKLHKAESFVRGYLKKVERSLWKFSS